MSAMNQIGSDRIPGGIAGVAEGGETSVEEFTSRFVEEICVFVEDGASVGEEQVTRFAGYLFLHICAGEIYQEIYPHV